MKGSRGLRKQKDANPFSNSLCKKSSCGHSCLYTVARRAQSEKAWAAPRWWWCPLPGLTAVLEQGDAQVAGGMVACTRVYHMGTRAWSQVSVKFTPTLTVCNTVSRELCDLPDTCFFLSAAEITLVIYVIGTFEPNSRC